MPKKSCARPGGSGAGAGSAWIARHHDADNFGDRPHGVDEQIETLTAKPNWHPAAPLRARNAHLRHSRIAVDLYGAVNGAALASLPALLARWLPDGRREGREYVARNPTRRDRRPGSFKVNLVTGRWADFATGEIGGDPIALAAYLFDLSRAEAARRLADTLGVR